MIECIKRQIALKEKFSKIQIYGKFNIPNKIDDTPDKIVQIMAEHMNNIIYILTNPVFSDMVKIGKTKNLEKRVKDLSSHAGIPVPFEVYYACTVEDSTKIEKGLHDGFGDHRINPKREFFRINPERVLSILKLVEIECIASNSDFVDDVEEKISLEKERSNRSKFKFLLANIEVGNELSFIRNEKYKAIVAEDNKIQFEGETTSLSKSALTILNRDFGVNWSSCAGPNFWIFENETLSERRLRLEKED